VDHSQTSDHLASGICNTSAVEEMSLNKQKLNQPTDLLPYFLYSQAARVCIPILTNRRGMKRGVPPAARTMGS